MLRFVAHFPKRAELFQFRRRKLSQNCSREFPWKQWKSQIIGWVTRERKVQNISVSGAAKQIGEAGNIQRWIRRLDPTTLDWSRLVWNTWVAKNLVFCQHFCPLQTQGCEMRWAERVAERGAVGSRQVTFQTFIKGQFLPKVHKNVVIRTPYMAAFEVAGWTKKFLC